MLEKLKKKIVRKYCLKFMKIVNFEKLFQENFRNILSR